MELLGFLVLAVATGLLWRRVDALRRTVREMHAELAARPAAPVGHAEEPASAVQVVPEPVPDASIESISSGAAESSRGRLADALPRLDFEQLFGRLLPIWAGGVALAAAGFFLVRWSIDQGLLTPAVRVALAGLFGIALLAGAEAAYRWRARVADPRVAQALAGAGLATLYAAFYLAGTAYGLIGSSLAFIGLAGVTAAAIALSYRFGMPSAVLGLVGGFAAPALVGAEEPDLPLLTIYLAFVTGGLAYTGRRQGRAWLGLAALAGGLGWGAVLLAGAVPGAPDTWAFGAYLVLLGAVIPALAGEGMAVHRPVQVAAAGLAALQLAALVRLGGFGALEWGLYLLLGAALAWVGWRASGARGASAAAAAVGIALLAFWPDPAPLGFAAVSAALAAIFGLVPLAHLQRRRGRPIDIVQAAGVALGLGVVAVGTFGAALPEAPDPVLGLALLALALLPAGAVGLSARAEASQRRPELLGAQAAAVLLGVGALAQVAPHEALAWLAAAGAALVAWRAPRLIGALATFALLAALWALAPLADWLQAGALALAGSPVLAAALPSWREVILYLAPTVTVGAAWGMLGPAGRARAAIATGAVVLAVVALHSAFRHAFAALAGEDFVATAVVQRAAWEALLLAAAWLAWRRGWRAAALWLAAAALAHFAWFAVVLHNPLWSAQAVGPLPLANALAPAYAAGFAALLLLRRWLPGDPPHWRWAIDAGAMAAAALLALSLLRQAYAGSLLTAVPIGQGEDLLRSLLGIVLAVGFLLWGARSGERSWRIGSLALMLLAVLKVFLVDAAALAGLARIASFMALGFSLIGIGWFYTRQLRRLPPAAAS